MWINQQNDGSRGAIYESKGKKVLECLIFTILILLKFTK